MLDLYGGTRPAQPPVAFRDFVDWRAGCDQQAAEEYWRTVLAGFEGPTPLGIARADTGETGLRDHRVPLPASLGAALSATAARERLTLATLMQGAWALLLSRYGGQGDVTFGTVLSARPADLPGAEEMIGLFLDTVPVRVQLAEDAGLWPWLRDIQRAQRQREAHGHVAMSDLQGWAGFQQQGDPQHGAAPSDPRGAV